MAVANPIMTYLTMENSLQGRDRAGLFTAIATGPVRYTTNGDLIGYFAEEATTNHCIRPYANSTATTYWAATTGVVDTDDTWFRATRNSATGHLSLYAGSGNRPEVSAGQSWTIQAEIDGTPGLSIELAISWWNGANGTGSLLGTVYAPPVVLEGVPVSLNLTAMAPSGAVSFVASAIRRGNGVVGDVIAGRYWQFEQKAYATTVAVGDMGAGYGWIGSPFASASTRANSVLRFASSGRADPNQGSFVVTVADLRTPMTGSPRFITIGEFGAAGGDNYILNINAGATTLSQTYYRGGVGAAGVASRPYSTPGERHIGYGAWDESLVAVALDASAITTAARTAPFGVFSSVNNQTTIGSVSSGIQHLNGWIGPVAIYDQPLSDSRRATVNAAIDAGTDLWALFEPYEVDVNAVSLDLATEPVAGRASVAAAVTAAELVLAGQAMEGRAGAVAVIEAGELDLGMPDVTAVALQGMATPAPKRAYGPIKAGRR